MKAQSQTLTPHEISGVVDAWVTTNRGADGSLAFHLLVGPADRPEECDRIEFALAAEHATVLFEEDARRPRPAVTSPIPVPCRVGVEFHSTLSARR
ncbi:hypothetical protein ACIQPR_12495 [Streptomyces sp. NPDC091280]|uniref:hypothetical protein n=1 Tax=unclassified Streptomyces TaxID=2593676 RepID=UPI00381739A7